MKWLRDPFKLYAFVAWFAPALFAGGLYLFYSDRALGEQVTVQEGGVVGLATNLSLTGLTAVVRFVVGYGPQAMVLIGLALPVVCAMYTVERAESSRVNLTRRRRVFLWSFAVSETAVMLAAFIGVFQIWPI